MTWKLLMEFKNLWQMVKSKVMFAFMFDGPSCNTISWATLKLQWSMRLNMSAAFISEWTGFGQFKICPKSNSDSQNTGLWD